MSGKLQEPTKTNYDVVIIGGAIYGSSIAWFLASNPSFNGTILVIEKDPSYEFSSTARTNSCLRHQFSQPINITISQFGANYIKNFQQNMNYDKRIPKILFRSFGYMYLANDNQFMSNLKKNQELQAQMGSGTKFLLPYEIKKQYPFYNVEDILGGTHNLIDEGYFDGNTMFEWWKKSASEKGVEFIHNEVVAMNINKLENKKITKIKLKSGNHVSPGLVVNASGPYAKKTASMANIHLPIEPRKRYSFIFKPQKPLDRDLPLTIDPSGIHMRSDGENYLAGCSPDIDTVAEHNDFDLDPNIWENKVWPILANRVPQFESIKIINSWIGHYAYNTFDQNAILGKHSTIKNFIFANGFSGHGLQQSPAIGKGISELIVFGEYRSLDLSSLDYNRLVENKPVRENSII